MASQTLNNVEWRRFHDSRKSREHPDVPTVLCADSVEDLIDICRARPATGKRLKAAGSHWSLSESTVSDHVGLESNWPGAEAVPRNTGLAIDLYELISSQLFDHMAKHPPVSPVKAEVDPCLSEVESNCFYVHLKSGTRVYEAYSLMDGMDATPTKLATELNKRSHPEAYSLPWGFMTLGGAGGQTVFGALTTGTHGGDFRQRPISDAVMALHLVTDGGDHFWIEPSSRRNPFPIADDTKLHAIYGRINPNVAFEIIRDDDVFDSVVVGVGRFGIVVSIVLRVVPQYCLLEHRRLDNWTSIKSILKDPARLRHHAFDYAFFSGDNPAADKTAFGGRFNNVATAQNRFLQIAINPSPHGHDEHRCGVTQRWFCPNTNSEAVDPNTGAIRGRLEMGTSATAGKTSGYVVPGDGGTSSGTFLSRACGSGNFIAGILRELAKELEQVIANNAVTAGGIIAATIPVGAGAIASAIVNVCAVLAAVVVALIALAEAIDAMGDASLAKVVDTVIKAVQALPVPYGIMIILLRCVFKSIFESQQKERDYVAISYAVMDGHDYLDRSCFANAESIEVFFDASRPDVYCAYVDAVLAFEASQQESLGPIDQALDYVGLPHGSSGRFTVGYLAWVQI